MHVLAQAGNCIIVCMLKRGRDNYLMCCCQLSSNRIIAKYENTVNQSVTQRLVFSHRMDLIIKGIKQC